MGKATNTPEMMNGINDLSKSTLIAKSGTQPIGEVLRIIKDSVIVAVKITVFLSHLLV